MRQIAHELSDIGWLHGLRQWLRLVAARVAGCLNDVPALSSRPSASPTSD
jgi:hypothetical protein